jgi:hypothetical protein
VSPLRVSDIWQGTADLLRGRLGLLFAVAAPFTLLVEMALRIFGPAPPASTADFTSRTLFWLVLLPLLIGSVAQLAITHLILRPDSPPRAALAAAFSAWPVYLAALMISSLPTGLGFLLLVLPGIYVTARLFLILPLAIVTPGPEPLAILRASWQLTRPIGWPLFGFFLLAILGLFGLSLLSNGVGSALGAVFTLIGFAGAGSFLAGLVPAVVSTLVTVASAGLASYLYIRLA